MWRLTLAINFILVAILATAAHISQIPLHLSLADANAPLPTERMPSFTILALDAYWLTYAVPILWLITSLLSMRFLQRHPTRRMELVSLHTSASLLIGISLFLFFAIAGIFPLLVIHQ